MKFGRKFLEEYEASELEFIQGQSADVVRRGFIANWTELYPEISTRQSTAFDRGGVPLRLLLLLYERVALYIPPTAPEILKDRWGMRAGTVLDLCEAGLVQPIIGHPTDYIGKHFESLFSLKPPSIWARGLGLLNALGMEDKLDEADRVLPVSEISRLSWVREHWREHFPTLHKKDLTLAIEREIRTLYADLWVFGEHLIAEGLVGLKDPDEIARKLRLVNEVRTYPMLFGLGGTAHYNAGMIRNEPLILEGIRRPSIILPPELDALARGIGIDIGQMTAREIIDFHASEAGKYLRQALHQFELAAIDAKSGDTEYSDLLAKAARLQEVVREAKQVLSSPESLRVIKGTERRVQWLLRIGGAALGALVARETLGAWTVLPGAISLGFLVVDRLLPASFRDAVTKEAISERFSPGIAHLWQALSSRR